MLMSLYIEKVALQYKTTFSEFYFKLIHSHRTGSFFHNRFDFNFEDTLFQLSKEQVQYRNQHQRKEGTEQQSKDHGPCQRSPECYVIATKEDMRVEISEQSHEVNVETNTQRNQSNGC